MRDERGPLLMFTAAIYAVMLAVAIVLVSVNRSNSFVTGSTEEWQAPKNWESSRSLAVDIQPLINATFTENNIPVIAGIYNQLKETNNLTIVDGDLRTITDWENILPGLVKQMHDLKAPYVFTIKSASSIYPTISDDRFNEGKIEIANVPHPVVSTIDPHWQEWMLDQLKVAIDAGVDGVLIEDLLYGSSVYPDFTPGSLNQFNTYLADNRPDLLTTDIKQLTLDRVTDNKLTIEAWQNVNNISTEEIFTLYREFLQQQHFVNIKKLITAAKEYSRSRYGRDLMVGGSSQVQLLNDEAIKEIKPDFLIVDYFDTKSTIDSEYVAAASRVLAGQGIAAWHRLSAQEGDLTNFTKLFLTNVAASNDAYFVDSQRLNAADSDLNGIIIYHNKLLASLQEFKPVVDQKQVFAYIGAGTKNVAVLSELVNRGYAPTIVDLSGYLADIKDTRNVPGIETAVRDIFKDATNQWLLVNEGNPQSEQLAALVKRVRGNVISLTTNPEVKQVNYNLAVKKDLQNWNSQFNDKSPVGGVSAVTLIRLNNGKDNGQFVINNNFDFALNTFKPWTSIVLRTDLLKIEDKAAVRVTTPNKQYEVIATNSAVSLNDVLGDWILFSYP